MFVKGQSGNPKGRPPLKTYQRDLAKYCKDLTPEALSVVLQIMFEAEYPRDRLRAAEIILERGWGLPHQFVDVEVKSNLLDILGSLAEERKQRRVEADVIDVIPEFKRLSED